MIVTTDFTSQIQLAKVKQFSGGTEMKRIEATISHSCTTKFGVKWHQENRMIVV
jgi:hypothetical protein